MKKDYIRNQVRSAVQVLFKHHNEGSVVYINNITLKFKSAMINTECANDPAYYTIEVWKNLKTYIDTFYVLPNYVIDYWELISKPWIYDFVNDITNLVMNNIEE